MKWRALLVMLSLAIPALAQDSLERQVMMRLKAALDPAISGFPETDDSGASPKGGNSDALWMVRLPEAGERTIEILANPLNEVNQIKARRAMAAIERNIEAAQRRAAAQYERAVAEAARQAETLDAAGVLAALPTLTNFDTGMTAPIDFSTSNTEAIPGFTRVFNTYFLFNQIEDGVVTPLGPDFVDVFAQP